RSHLVGERHPQVRRSLSRVDADLSARAHHRGDSRRADRTRGQSGEPLMPLEVQSLAEWEAGGVPGLLSVVIPAHNEEGRIARTVQDLYRALSGAGIAHEILVVNDNSQD